jgi:hypothetical protein
MMNTILHRLIGALALLIIAVVSGCGSEEQVYDLSGEVSFQGKPVPMGTIVFEPDVTKGNNGPSGYAKIRDGRYDTRDEEGQGTMGGPHLVRILGLDGVARGELLHGLPVFPEYTTTAELPRETSTLDFVVPQQ